MTTTTYGKARVHLPETDEWVNPDDPSIPAHLRPAVDKAVEHSNRRLDQAMQETQAIINKTLPSPPEILGRAAEHIEPGEAVVFGPDGLIRKAEQKRWPASDSPITTDEGVGTLHSQRDP